MDPIPDNPFLLVALVYFTVWTGEWKLETDVDGVVQK